VAVSLAWAFSTEPSDPTVLSRDLAATPELSAGPRVETVACDGSDRTRRALTPSSASAEPATVGAYPRLPSDEEDAVEQTGADPDVPAARALVAAGIEFTTADVSGVTSAEEAAARQGIPDDHLIKTIVVRRADDDHVFVLVPAGRAIDWPKLRAHLGVSRISLPDPDEARAATGYERGTITPFGATTAWPVIADATIPGKGRISLGSGRRGTAIQLDADTVVDALDAEVADVTGSR
jgi:Cys-tRNA(Pro)/Cys-tRNA(Cys) deacylase